MSSPIAIVRAAACGAMGADIAAMVESLRTDRCGVGPSDVLEQVPAVADSQAVPVQFEGADALPARLCDLVSPAQAGPYARDQFARRKRLGNVIIRAHFQPQNSVKLLRACG